MINKGSKPLKYIVLTWYIKVPNVRLGRIVGCTILPNGVLFFLINDQQ